MSIGIYPHAVKIRLQTKTVESVNPVVTPDAIETYIREKLECPYLQVTGDGAHFEAVIVSPAFAGKSRVQRHQIVYGALGARMREEIHALSMKTLSPDEWASTLST